MAHPVGLMLIASSRTANEPYAVQRTVRTSGIVLLRCLTICRTLHRIYSDLASSDDARSGTEIGISDRHTGALRPHKHHCCASPTEVLAFRQRRASASVYDCFRNTIHLAGHAAINLSLYINSDGALALNACYTFTVDRILELRYSERMDRV